MLSWEIRLLCGLLKKVNDKWWQTTTNDKQTSEIRAISAAKVDVDADSDADADAVADADAAAELSNKDKNILSDRLMDKSGDEWDTMDCVDLTDTQKYIKW